MISSEKKAQVTKDLKAHDKDTGSPVVQVGIMTARIAELTDHMKRNKHDFAARRLAPYPHTRAHAHRAAPFAHGNRVGT